MFKQFNILINFITIYITIIYNHIDKSFKINYNIRLNIIYKIFDIEIINFVFNISNIDKIIKLLIYISAIAFNLIKSKSI